MGNQWGLGLHLIFVSVFLVATTYTCLGARNMTVACSSQEGLALLNFKHSVKDQFKMLSSWVGNDCCRWEGVRCDVATGRVVSLHLRGNVWYEVYYLVGDDSVGDDSVVEDHYLVGDEVKSSLAELRHLKYLDLSGNDFRGSRIPEFIGSFKQLSYLNLSNANFSGIISPHIGNLSHLEGLDLSHQQLKADDMAWVSGLSLLKHLVLSRVDLSGAQNVDMVLYMIPSLIELSLSHCHISNLGPLLNLSRTLPNIRHLDLSFNYFEGQLPGFFQNMTSLAFLDLSSFDLSQAWNSANLLNMFPSLSELYLSNCWLHNMHLSPTHLNFSTHSNIQLLDLSENSIEGRFLSVLTNMSSLRFLDLAENRLNSSIPVMPNLLMLDLEANNFKQIKHVGIWRQCHLKQLVVSTNDLGGEMIGRSTNVSECSQYALEMLFLDENQLNGSIPESLRRLTNLRVLDLSSNRLTGLIPEALGRLRFLEVLGLSSNRLNGSIPTFLGRLTSLQEFSVSSNLLNGAIPVSIGQLIKLKVLDVSNNSLEGVVSEAHFANLSMLKHLNTTSNSKLTFNVSREWMPPFQLRTALLGSCKIADEFPQWFRMQRKLQTLVLSNASISGPLPTWLRKMPIIPHLDLSHNKLSGPLTTLPLGNPPLIRYGNAYGGSLLLQNNHFNGSIPRSLCRRTDLTVLELSRNRLTGKIRNCLGNLQHLYAMIFSSNELSGVIPSSLGHISRLTLLSLNDNNFIGELPQDLGNLGGLTVLDLGDNKFSGNISKWIGEKLTDLNILRLHKNNFTGRIPPSLCKSSNLQILDVAHNSLTGPIPRCFGELNGMVNGSQLIADSDISDFNVIQVINGVYHEYNTTLQYVINMDLSSNKLVGEIPEEVTTLFGLVGLNLSHNHLSGGIPNSIGNMKALISLDFSENELTGMIPPSMSALNFLSHLNLSHNNFSGQIPTGNQLQTLIDPSIYAGNRDLCGAPLPKNCSNHEDPTTITSEDKYEAADEPEKVWFYLDIMCGFATGFWSVIGVLLFKKRWRHKLFTFAEVTMDKIHVAVLVRVSKMRRGREAA